MFGSASAIIPSMQNTRLFPNLSPKRASVILFKTIIGSFLFYIGLNFPDRFVWYNVWAYYGATAIMLFGFAIFMSMF
jgi:hypothetical protein